MTKQNKMKIVLDVDDDIEKEQEGFPDFDDKWRLKVFDDQGKQIGGDYTQLDRPMEFWISDVTKTSSLIIENEKRRDLFWKEDITSEQTDQDLLQEFRQQNTISANLSPVGGMLNKTYRTFGSSENIKEIRLELSEDEYDVSWIRMTRALHTPSTYYPDMLLINARLSSETFRDLWDRLSTDDFALEGSLRLEKCSGFYAIDSSSSFPPSNIMILTDDDDLPVQNIPDGYRVPTVGVVGSFSVNFFNKFAEQKDESSDLSNENADMMEIKESLKFLETQTKEQTRGLGVTNGLLLVLVIFGLAILFQGT